MYWLASMRVTYGGYFKKRHRFFFLSVSKYYLFIKISLNNLILCLKIFRKLEMFLNLEI